MSDSDSDVPLAQLMKAKSSKENAPSTASLGGVVPKTGEKKAQPNSSVKKPSHASSLAKPTVKKVGAHPKRNTGL
jgi:hypothetical protein